MPRPLALALLLLVPAAAAQGGSGPSPEEVAAAYFGLEVGAVWEYELARGETAEALEVVGRERWEVVEETTTTLGGGVAGPAYVVVGGAVGGEAEECLLVPGDEYGDHRLWVANHCALEDLTYYGIYYGASAGPVCYGVSGEEVCGDGADYVRTQQGGSVGNHSYRTHTTSSVRGLGVVAQLSERRSTNGGVLSTEARARRLTYARVGGLEVGAAMPVAAEPGPAPLAVSVVPTVTAGPVEARADGPGRLAVFDLRGRLVLEAEVPPGGRLGLDLGGRPAGLYLVRLEAGGRASTARVVVAR